MHKIPSMSSKELVKLLEKGGTIFQLDLQINIES